MEAFAFWNRFHISIFAVKYHYVIIRRLKPIDLYMIDCFMKLMLLHNSLDKKGAFIAVSMVPACTTKAFHDVITGPVEWFAIKLVRSFQEEAVNSAMNENRKYLKDFQFCKEVVKRR